MKEGTERVVVVDFHANLKGQPKKGAARIAVGTHVKIRKVKQNTIFFETEDLKGLSANRGMFNVATESIGDSQ